MTTPAPYIEALERALGRVIAETRAEGERQVELVSARADAVIAKLEARNVELEGRIADLERSVRDQVEAGITSGLGEIEERLAERLRPDEAPVVALAERVEAVEARGAEFATLAERLAEVESRELPDVTEIARGVVSEAIADLPKPESLDPLRGEIEAVRDAIPEAPDLSGFLTREEAEAALAEVRGAIPTVPEPKDWTEEIQAVTERTDTGLSELRRSVDQVSEDVRERLARHPGNFPRLKAWSDGVHYAGDVRMHGGSVWQATKDTGREPSHEGDDWFCIVAKGDKGEDGRSHRPRGTYDPEVRDYRELDEVIVGGSTFVAVRDDPGECPGDGWQLSASRGSKGKQGEKGDPGRDGRHGEPVVGLEFTDDGTAIITNGDGSTVEGDLYPLLAKVKP